MEKLNRVIPVLYWIAAAYDGLLGVIFLFSPTRILLSFGIQPPHPGYIQFSAALLIIFSLMFIAIAREPIRNRGLIVYGVLLKVSYCGVVFSYWARSGLPYIWKPFAIADLVFAILFLWSYVLSTRGARNPQPHGGNRI